MKQQIKGQHINKKAKIVCNKSQANINNAIIRESFPNKRTMLEREIEIDIGQPNKASKFYFIPSMHTYF